MTLPPALRRSALALCLGLSVGLGSLVSSAGVWPTEVDKLTRQLDSSDVAERRAAASKLSALPAHLATPLVQHALDDPDIDVRLAASAAAVAQKTPAVEDRVLGWLNEPDARVRLAACQVLRPGPSPKATGLLARVLGDPDQRVRQAAAVALGNASSPDAVVALLGHLDDPTPEVRAAVVDALWRLGDARAVVPLVGKMQDSVVEVRRAVARALGELGDGRATAALVLALRDASVEVRVDALMALGNIGDPTSVLAIAPLAEPQQSPEVRRAALSALGRIGGPRSLAILIAALERDDAAAGRAPARDALIKVGQPAVAPLLAVLAAPPSERSASFAAEALGMLHAPQAREPIVQALRKGVLPAAHALRALSALGDPAALPVVLELLSDRSAAVRAESRRATWALLDPRSPHGFAVDPIAAVLDDPRTPLDERAALARLLGRTRSPRAAKIVAPLAASQSPPLRLAALDALGALGDVGEDGPLVAALDDENPVVRARAGASLATAASEATLLSLLDRIGSAQQQDRAALASAVAGALARSRSEEAARRAEALLPTSEGPMRDALLEGLGRMDQPLARAALERLSSSADVGDRRKTAEALAAQAASIGKLRSLLGDFDAGVRASAAWGLGAAGSAQDIALLSPLLADASAAVAANAAVSIGRVAARAGSADEAKKALCPLLRDGRSYVRVGALAGLAAAHARCGEDGEPERSVLAQDAAPLARAAAADLILLSPAKAEARDRRALSRCRLEDTHGSVAARCGGALTPPAGDEPVTVLVVPDGQSKASAEAPFALVLADRSIRHGVTDRRGAIFEAHAPRGVVSLEVPAPFVR